MACSLTTTIESGFERYCENIVLSLVVDSMALAFCVNDDDKEGARMDDMYEVVWAGGG